MRTAAFLVDARRRFLTTPIQSDHPSRLRSQRQSQEKCEPPRPAGPIVVSHGIQGMPHTPTMRPMVSNSRAGKSLRDLRVAEVVQLSLQLDAKAWTKHGYICRWCGAPKAAREAWQHAGALMKSALLLLFGLTLTVCSSAIAQPSPSYPAGNSRLRA